jgi:VWFA-related protein
MSTHMARSAAYAAVLLLAIPRVAGTQQPPVFRAGVGLVTLDVRVLDGEGRPVTGLTEDDFTVELAGRKQPVRLVEYVEYPGAGAVPELVDPIAPAVPGRPPARPARVGGRAVMLAIDDLSLRPPQAQGYVAAARRLIAGLGGNDSVQVATTGNRVPRSGMSRDKTRALLALNMITGARSDSTQDGSGQRVGAGPTAGSEIVLSSAEALAIQSGNGSVYADVTQRICGRALQLTGGMIPSCGVAVKGEAAQQAVGLERTLNAQFESLLDMIAALRLEAAPRILILLSGGADTDPNRATQIDTLRSAAAEAGVQVHVVTSVLTTGTDASDRTVARSRVRRDNDEYSRRGLEFVADKLDAELVRAIGGPDRGIDRLLLGWAGSYRVGVEPPAAVGRGGPLPVAITVRRPGVTVKGPRSITVRDARGSSTSSAAASPASAGAAAPSSEATLARLVDDGGAEAGVPMAVGVLSKRDETGRDVQVVTVEVPAATAGPLSGLFAATDESNRLIARGTLSFVQPSPGDDYRVSVVVPLVPGPFRLRVAVADRAGAVGSMEHAGTSRLSRLRSSSVSDLLLSWIGDDRQARFVAMESVPETARTLQASLEFYSSADPAGTTVRMAIVKEGATAPVAEALAAPIKTPSGWRLGVSVPLSSLEPGVYLVRATVKEGTDPPLILSRSVRLKAR